jgi:hypothetical protein
MEESNPYTSPTAVSTGHANSQSKTKKQLWFAYAIAPLVAPSLAAVVIFFGGLFLSDPNDTGTPVGIVLLPIVMMTVGVGISYFLALVVGMPVVFWLSRRNRLTGFSIHLAAVGVALIIAAVFTLIGVITEGGPTLFEGVQFFALAVLVIAAFLLTSTAVFWMVASFKPKSESVV